MVQPRVSSHKNTGSHSELLPHNFGRQSTKRENIYVLSFLKKQDLHESMDQNLNIICAAVRVLTLCPASWASFIMRGAGISFVLSLMFLIFVA